MQQFAFLHVGPDIAAATILVRSLRAHNGRCSIVQCTDEKSPSIAGVDRAFRFAGDPSNLMMFRALAFAALNNDTPTLFLDTDMVCLAAIDVGKELGENDACLCRRDFDRNRPVKLRGAVSLPEYDGLPMSEVFPFVGCATITRDGRLWAACVDEMQKLPPKLQRWFGDQLALKTLWSRKSLRLGEIPERIFACLPEHRHPLACMLHYKGAERKLSMLREFF